MTAEPAKKSVGFEINNSRLIAHPREKVFEAFAAPEKLKHWWGPNGFTNTIQRFDFRPGGDWHTIMHGPDGKDYPNESQFTEISRPGRIVFEHLRPFHWYRMTMTYTDIGGKTSLTWQMEFKEGGDNEQLKAFIASANEQNLDRLEAQLKSQS